MAGALSPLCQAGSGRVRNENRRYVTYAPQGETDQFQGGKSIAEVPSDRVDSAIVRAAGMLEVEDVVLVGLVMLAVGERLRTVSPELSTDHEA